MEQEQTLEDVNAESLMIDDLAGQVARKAVEVSQWKARALKAEAIIDRLKREAENTEEPEDEQTD